MVKVGEVIAMITPVGTCRSSSSGIRWKLIAEKASPYPAKATTSPQKVGRRTAVASGLRCVSRVAARTSPIGSSRAASTSAPASAALTHQRR